MKKRTKPTVNLIVSGGIVQGVYSDIPGLAVVIKDFDNRSVGEPRWKYHALVETLKDEPKE